MSGLASSALDAGPVLITGATGFIGSQFARYLAAQGHQVRALHRPSSDLTPLAALDLELYEGDLLDPGSLATAADGAVAIFHCGGLVAGWRRAGPLQRSHVDGTRNMLRTAWDKGVRRFIHVSSVAALGLPAQDDNRVEAGMREDHPWNGDGRSWPYAYAKHLAEVEVQWAVKAGLQAVTVCPSAVFGPGDIKRSRGGILARMVDRRLPPIAPAGGLNIVHLDDVLEGMLAAWRHGQTGRRYLLTGANLSHYDFLTTLATIVGRRPPGWRLPSAPLRALGGLAGALPDWLPVLARIPMLQLAGLHFYYDNRASQRALNLSEPRPVEQALQAAYDWHLAAHASPEDATKAAPSG